MAEQRYRQGLKCSHCRNTVAMPIVATYSQVREHEAKGGTIVWAAGNVYEILTCPACDSVTFQRGHFHDQFPEGVGIRRPVSDRGQKGGGSPA